MFWGCLSAGTASGSIVHQKHHHEFSYVYPPSRRVALARRAALAREPRAGEQSGAAPLPNARSRRHCWISDIAPSAGALDGTFGVTPLFAESLRAARHLVRRMAMRWVVVAPRGVPARGGCGGGLVGSQEDCALLASWPGPLWRPEAAMRLLWRDWRQALPASGTAWVVRRVLRASCVYGVVAERRFTFANTCFLLVPVGAGVVGAANRRRGPRRRLHTRRHLCSGPRPLKRCVNEIADIRWE